jgi:transcription elongation factor GreA
MPNMNKIPMTQFGEKQLRTELAQLQAQRPEISKAIGVARENGDLSENADYHAARERQGLAEARIRYIEGQLANAQVVDITKIPNKDKVVFGATVHLVNVDTDDEMRYQIVGEDEADIKQAKISVGSPLARALIGKQVGDAALVETPNSKIEYEIIKIEYIA